MPSVGAATEQRAVGGERVCARSQGVGELSAGVEHQSNVVGFVVTEQAAGGARRRDRSNHLAVGLVADRHADRREASSLSSMLIA